jgi:hypothetical protein
MVIRTTTPRQVSSRVARESNSGTAVMTRVTPRAETQGERYDSDEGAMSRQVLRDIESDDESITKEHLVLWYRTLQEKLIEMKEENEELRMEITELRESATRETSEMLGRAQVQYYQVDPRIFRQINAVVLEKIFPYKKFIVDRKDQEDFKGKSSLGMVVMNIMKVKQVDRLPFWTAYKEIVTDAIGNRWTTITNDMKKIVMSKYKKKWSYRV